ncbi:MAG: cation:proton antiporter, partial [Calditrichia bacterium]
MVRLSLIITAFFIFMAAVTTIKIPENLPMAENVMALGFILIAAYLTGKIALRINLPKITGYILAGIIAGPFIFNLLSPVVVTELQLIDQIALSLIALTAGGEFRFKILKEQFRTMNLVFAALLVLLMSSAVLLIFLIYPVVPFLQGKMVQVVLGTGLLFGIVSITMSPATTIAIISETRAKGRFTDFILGMTIFIDIAVVLLFSLVLALSRPLILMEGGFRWQEMLPIIMEIFFSITAGALYGWLITLYLKHVGKQAALFLLGFII